MIYNRQGKNNRGIAFAEYVFLMGLFAGAIILINAYMQQRISAKVGQMTDAFIGSSQTGEVSPYNVAGGKQLANPSGLYVFSGVTNKEEGAPDLLDKSANSIYQEKYAGGARRLAIQKHKDITESPGKGMGNIDGMGFELPPLADYKFEDNGKAPVYVPDFVQAQDGYIVTPNRN